MEADGIAEMKRIACEDASPIEKKNPNFVYWQVLLKVLYNLKNNYPDAAASLQQDQAYRWAIIGGIADPARRQTRRKDMDLVVDENIGNAFTGVNTDNTWVEIVGRLIEQNNSQYEKDKKGGKIDFNPFSNLTGLFDDDGREWFEQDITASVHKAMDILMA